MAYFQSKPDLDTIFMCLSADLLRDLQVFYFSDVFSLLSQAEKKDVSGVKKVER